MTYTLKPLGVLAVLCAVSLAQAEPVGKGPWPFAKTEGPKVEILAYDNGDVSPWMEFFTFDSPKHPQIVQFRTEYKLDEVIANAKTDIQRAALLEKRVAGNLKFGTPAPDVFNDWSAVALLGRVKIVLCPGEEKWIFAQLWNGDPEFDHYQFRLNSGDWEDVPKTNTRDFTGRLHGWGLDRFSVEGKPGVYGVTVRVVRHDGSTGPESSVKFRVE